MSWHQQVYAHVLAHCNAQGTRTFNLQDFLRDHLESLQACFPNNHHAEAKIRQQLQLLRDRGLLNFMQRSGHYTLRSPDWLDVEKEAFEYAARQGHDPDKREYLIETHVRKTSYTRKAMACYGSACYCEDCKNIFERADGTPYIEWHHITALHEGGEDAIWNLAPLCAHHHKMAHFSALAQRRDLQAHLLAKVQRQLDKLGIPCLAPPH